MLNEDPRATCHGSTVTATRPTAAGFAWFSAQTERSSAQPTALYGAEWARIWVTRSTSRSAITRSKTHWDFLTNRAGSIPSLMTAEANVTSWPAKDNHYERVRDLLSAAQQTKLNAAAGGNIFDGAAQ
jgi:hypothetical protein